jgi:hypothetical protein
MMFHPRLNADSPFGLLEPTLVHVIAYFFSDERSIQAFLESTGAWVDPNHSSVRFFGEVIADWHSYFKQVSISSYPVRNVCMVMDLRLKPKQLNSFYSMKLRASSFPDSVDAGSEVSNLKKNQYVRILINDPVISGMIDFTDATSDELGWGNLRIVQRFEHSKKVLAENVSFTMIEDQLFYSTKAYDVDTEGAELRSLIDTLLSLIFAEESCEDESSDDESGTCPQEDESDKCPQCRQPMIMGDGGMPGTLCIRCLRANRD